MNQEIYNLVKGRKLKAVAAATTKARENWEDVKEILNPMIDAMGEIGEGFKTDAIFISEMLVATMTMQAVCDKIGAGCYTLDPATAAEKVKELVS